MQDQITRSDARQPYHCPPWCVVDPEEHARDLDMMDGASCHWSVDLADGAELEEIRIGLTTEPDGKPDGEPAIFDGPNLVPAVDASKIAAALTHGLAIIAASRATA